MNRKTIITIGLIAGLLISIVIALLGLSLYGKAMMGKIPALSFDEALHYTLQDNEGAVVTVGLLKDGQASYTVYGPDGAILPPTLHTYEIGSLTKTFTATLVAKAVQEGRISLDDTIDQYIALPSNNTYPTIEQLLTHTSGYKSHYFAWPMAANFFTRDNDFFGITKAMVRNRLASLSMPDTTYAYEYSNFGYATLALVLEEIYDQEYAALVTALACDDLHLPNTHISDKNGDLGDYWQWKAGDAYLSAGGLVSTIEDMLAYAQLQLGKQGYIGSSQESLQHIGATNEQYELLGIRLDWIAMAWIIDEKNGFIWHNGATSKYNSYLAFDPVRQIAVVILSNLSAKSRIPATVLGVKLMQGL